MTEPALLRAALLRDAVVVSGARVRVVHFVIFPLTVILGVFLWDVVPRWQLILPLAFINLVALRGVWLGREFSKISDDAESIELFARRFRVGIALYGVALGAIGTCLYVHDDVVYQLPVILVVVGAAAGGITTQVGFPRAMHLFHALAFGPPIVGLLVDGRSSSMAVASMLAIYGLGLTIVGRGGARAFRQQSLLKIEKSILADELEAARDELEVANDLLDQRVQEVADRLAQANQLASLGKLAAGVAHEINNPLTWVVSNAKFVRNSIDAAIMERTAKQQLLEAADDIVTGGSRMAAIVRDMSSLARDDDSTDPVDIHKLIERCSRVARGQIGNRAELELELEAKAPVVLGSATRLSQLVLNLLMNASEAIGPDQSDGCIVVRTHAVDGELILDITDNGRGIADGDLERVFEPFFTTKRAGDGCGLGLPICRNIAVEHGGSIAAKPSEGGAAFMVKLPLEQREAPASVPEAISA